VRLLLLFLLVVVPIVEISVIVAVGQQIGAVPTVLLLLASAVVGTWLLRREGAKAWRAFRVALDERRPPAAEVVDGVLVLAGGLLMMLPGFVTDVLGLLLVLPPTRRIFRGVALVQLAGRLPAGVLGPLYVRSRRQRSAGSPPPPPQPSAPAPVLEGEVLDGHDDRN
jgi:UPF0716 protein FxsA